MTPSDLHHLRKLKDDAKKIWLDLENLVSAAERELAAAPPFDKVPPPRKRREHATGAKR